MTGRLAIRTGSENRFPEVGQFSDSGAKFSCSGISPWMQLQDSDLVNISYRTCCARNQIFDYMMPPPYSEIKQNVYAPRVQIGYWIISGYLLPQQ